jgi:hypothetical protein
MQTLDNGLRVVISCSSVVYSELYVIHPKSSLVHPITTSSLPAPVDSLAAVSLTLLQRNHRPPLLLVDRVDISAGLDAHAAPGAPGRQAVHLRHVDERTRVELERGLGAEGLEVDLGVGVVEADELVEGLRAGVQLDAARVVVDDEAVVRLGGFGAQGELFVGVEFGVGFDGTCGDGVVVDDLVEVAGESHACAFDRRAAGDVEVAGWRLLAK